MIGCAPSLSGESWFAVECTLSWPPFRLSQAQPLPKRFAAASANCCLKFSSEPKVAAIATGSCWVDAPAAGAMIFQKETVVHVAAGVVADAGADRGLDAGQVAHQRLGPASEQVGVVL